MHQTTNLSCGHNLIDSSPHKRVLTMDCKEFRKLVEKGVWKGEDSRKVHRLEDTMCKPIPQSQLVPIKNLDLPEECLKAFAQAKVLRCFSEDPTDEAMEKYWISLFRFQAPAAINVGVVVQSWDSTQLYEATRTNVSFINLALLEVVEKSGV